MGFRRKSDKEILAEIKKEKKILSGKLERQELEDKLKAVKQKSFRTTKKFKVASAIGKGFVKTGRAAAKAQIKAEKQQKKKKKKSDPFNIDIFGGL